jgi:hypothetical protein
VRTIAPRAPIPTAMNAVRHLVRLLPPAAHLRLAKQRGGRFDATAPVADAATHPALADAVADRYGGDLAELLNACHGAELDALAAACSVAAPPVAASPLRQPALRAALWRWGAAFEAGTDALIGTALQPMPRLLGGRLVHHAPPRGAFAASTGWPRPLPAAAAAAPPPDGDEPDTVDELLAAADRAIGVRLGARGRDKGAWGGRAAALLGVVERGDDAPDWRGDVELKTVPVAPEADGAWRVAEDPAIAMRGAAPPVAKLQRVLWLVRAPVGADDATILSWYLLEWDAHVARLAEKYLHTRPKGPAGTAGLAWYLHRRFFAEAGLLATLNGSGVCRE